MFISHGNEHMELFTMPWNLLIVMLK
jgi:hypothetical protein